MLIIIVRAKLVCQDEPDSSLDIENHRCEQSHEPNMTRSEAKQSLIPDIADLQLIFEFSQQIFPPGNPVLFFNPLWRKTIDDSQDASAQF